MERDDAGREPGPRLDALTTRIDALEERIALLEAGAADDRARAPGLSRSAIPVPPPPAQAALPDLLPPPVMPVPAAVPDWTGAAWWTNPEPAMSAAPAVTDGEEAGPPLPFVLPPARPALSLRDLEERFAGRALAWIGGLALVAAAIFFLSLAFSRGWINEPMRVGIGLAAGLAGLAGGAVFLARRSPLLGNVLTAVGLGILSISLFAATRSYHLVSPEAGLAGALVVAVAAAAIAVRFDAREVAAFGLIATLIAPPVVGASPTTLTLAFVAVTLVGTTAIALFRSWRWLPPLAFILVVPQLADWLGKDPDAAQALVALAGFWLVNIVAAAGEENRIRRDDLRPSSATLVLANATFLLWGGFVVLGGDLEPWRGTFLAVASLAHLLVGARFLVRQGLGHLFGNLVAGTGVALLAIATFVQLGAAVVPLAWAAEAVALAWLAVRRRHRWSAAASLVLAGLVVSHLLLLEYPFWQAGVPALVHLEPPFLHPAAGSLASVCAAVAVAIVVIPIRWVRSALAAGAVLLAAHALTFELAGPSLALGLVLLAIGGVLLDRLLAALPEDGTLLPVAGWVRGGWIASVAGMVAGGMAVALLFSTEFPPVRLGTLSAAPFWHPAAASLAIVLAGLAAVGALVGARWFRSALAGIGILLLAWAMPFEVADTTLVALLAVLLPAGVILDRALTRLPEQARFAGLAGLVPELGYAVMGGAVAWAGAAGLGLSSYIGPLGWGSITPPAVPFTDARALAAALLAGTALAACRWLPDGDRRRASLIAALVVAALVVPYEVFADGVVVLWVGLAVIGALLARRDGRGRAAYLAVAGGLGVGAALVAWGIVAPVDRLWVVDPALTGRRPMLAGWPVSFAAVGIALAVLPRLIGSSLAVARRMWPEAAAGVTVVYLVSVAVVDAFQRGTGGPVAVEELGKQAQVALSVCWTGIGALALLAGLTRRQPMARHAGFGLLGLATAKVFLIDLAAMDVAYRALVLAGLGLLLLASAFLFTHFRGPRSGAAGVRGGPHPAG